MSHKSDLVYYAKRCYEKGFVAATDGNISIRLSSGNILTTCSGVCKGRLKPSDLVTVNSGGKLVRGSSKPSTELKMHLYIYSVRKDVNAVVHTHPTFATAFAVARIALNKQVLPEVYLTFKKIPLAKYATPSTKEVPASISKLVKDHKAILLSNHGLVTFGRTLEEAYFLTEKAEQFAEISFYARLLGGEKKLTKQQLNKLKNLKY